MKRRDFFKAAGAAGIAAPVAVAQASSKFLPESDPLKALIAWVEESFACEQGLLGPWADEEGKHAYLTFRLGVLPDKYPGGEDAAKRALVDELRRWLSPALRKPGSRPVLMWRSPIQFNDGTVYEKKLGKLLATREQMEDFAFHIPCDEPVEDPDTGNYYDKVEHIPVRSMRIRTRLFIPGDSILVGVPEGAPTRYLA